MNLESDNERAHPVVHSFLKTVVRVPDADLEEFAKRGVAQDSVWDVAHPVGRLTGIDQALDGLFRPLRHALSNIIRRNELFIGGRNARSNGGNWVASVAHYVGNFDFDLFGIEPTHSLVFLRSGEFYRIESEMIVDAKIIIDFPDLMMTAGRNPFPRSPGTEMLFPAPDSREGILPEDPVTGAESLAVVNSMQSNLHAYDPVTLESRKQTGENGCWHPDFLWFGPAGVGSSYRWEGFVKDHRKSFLTAFPDRKGGDHFCRIGDGNFVATGGWPSMTMTHMQPYLGVPETKRRLSLRAMDFYRCDEAKIIENWVFLDLCDLFLQMGVDLFERYRNIDND